MVCGYHADGAKQNEAKRACIMAAQNGQIVPSGEIAFRHRQQHDQAKADPQRFGHAPGCQAL
jgi:hypothetical protein